MLFQYVRVAARALGAGSGTTDAAIVRAALDRSESDGLSGPSVAVAERGFTAVWRSAEAGRLWKVAEPESPFVRAGSPTTWGKTPLRSAWAAVQGVNVFRVAPGAAAPADTGRPARNASMTASKPTPRMNCIT